MDSAARGWPPSRYLDAHVAFVVAGMTVKHFRELRYGEQLAARTWIHDFRRDMLTRRQVRILGEDGLVSEATQQWVHVATGGQTDGGGFTSITRPVRASVALLSAFQADGSIGEPVALPSTDRLLSGPVHSFSFCVWQLWMDPLAHVNHPTYLDWCDEGTSRVLAASGHDPQRLLPVAEQVRFKSGVVGGTDVVVECWLKGQTEHGDAVIGHRILGAEGAVVVLATTVRRCVGGDAQPIIEAMLASPGGQGSGVTAS